MYVVLKFLYSVGLLVEVTDSFHTIATILDRIKEQLISSPQSNDEGAN